MPPEYNGQNKECCCCSNLNCRKLEIKTEYPKKKLLTRAIESFYDNCAAYNLRYIPYRTVIDRKTCLKSIMKDMIVLFCFLVTNFIVLLTILSRMVMHVSGVFLVTIDWIKQVLVSEALEAAFLTSQVYTHCQTPTDPGTINKPDTCLRLDRALHTPLGSYDRAHQKSILCLLYKERGNCNGDTTFDPSINTHE